MLKITVLAIGNIKKDFFNKALDEYSKRLKPYIKLDFIELKAESFNKSNKAQIKKIESNKLLKNLEKYESNNIFLLDERGKNLSSYEMARILDLKQELIFVIGGSLGFSEDLLNKYQKISLSKMTFPHEMVRVILLEQIYRGITINKGKEYHY